MNYAKKYGKISYFQTKILIYLRLRGGNILFFIEFFQSLFAIALKWPGVTSSPLVRKFNKVSSKLTRLVSTWDSRPLSIYDRFCTRGKSKKNGCPWTNVWTISRNLICFVYNLFLKPSSHVKSNRTELNIYLADMIWLLLTFGMYIFFCLTEAMMGGGCRLGTWRNV